MKDAQYHTEMANVGEEFRKRTEGIHREFQEAVKPHQERMEEAMKPHNEWYSGEVERIEKENAIRNGLTAG